MNIIRCPEQELSADYGEIIIGNVSSKLDFKITCNQEAVLSETYYPDNAGNVYIRDIARLSEMYRQESVLSADAGNISGAVTFNLEFKEENQTLTKTARIYTCDLETAGTLTPDVLKSIPLTRCFNKTVCPGQKEYISFYGVGTISLLVIYTGTVKDLSRIFSFATLPDVADAVHPLDVSPNVIAGLAGIEQSQIVYYILYKDKNCRIKFNMNRYLQSGKTFAFINSFGAQETFTCYGDSENERKWTREYGQIKRKQHLINGYPTATHTVHTGYLSREQTEIIEDLLNSRKIVLIDEFGYHPVIIAEETFKVQSRYDELIDVEFKYRIASENQLQYRFNPHKYRIFDYTHDKTYN